MQISKFPLWICAFALGGAISLHAEDTPAQAAARAALLQQMQEPNNSAPATTPAPEAPAAATAPTPPPAAAAPAETPAPTAPAADTAAPAATPQPEAAPAAPAETTAPAATTPAATEMAPVAQPGDNEAQAKARAALLEQMGGTATSAPVATPVATPAPAKAGKAAQQPATATVAPALPIAMSKEQKLQALLAKYKADQLTPQQYHEQRAAILAEP